MGPEGSVPAAHCQITLSRDRIRTNQHTSWCLWMSLIIQEYPPMLCYSHLAGGGIMLLATKENSFSCCLSCWNSPQDFQKENKLIHLERQLCIYLFIYIPVSCLTRKLLCNQCNLLAVYWYHCPLMLKSLLVELHFVSE